MAFMIFFSKSINLIFYGSNWKFQFWNVKTNYVFVFHNLFLKIGWIRSFMKTCGNIKKYKKIFGFFKNVEKKQNLFLEKCKKSFLKFFSVFFCWEKLSDWLDNFFLFFILKSLGINFFFHAQLNSMDFGNIQ